MSDSLWSFDPLIAVSRLLTSYPRKKSKLSARERMTVMCSWSEWFKWWWRVSWVFRFSWRWRSYCIRRLERQVFGEET